MRAPTVSANDATTLQRAAVRRDHRALPLAAAVVPMDDDPVGAGQAMGQRRVGEQRRIVAAPACRVQHRQPRDV